MSMCEFDQNLETMPCSERNSIRECAYLRKELDQNNCVNEYKRRELGTERGASHREVLLRKRLRCVERIGVEWLAKMR